MDGNSTAQSQPTIPTTNEVLNFFSIFNVQGLKPMTVQSTVPYIQDLLVEKNQLFMALTETWLSSHKDAEVDIEGYTLFRSDRIRKKAKRGRCSGGVALYVREELAATMKTMLKYSNGVNEALVVYSKKENVAIVVVYRQPDDSRNGHKSTNEEFMDVILKIRSTLQSLPGRSPDILVCGDFNLPHVEWPQGVIKSSSSRDEKVMLEELKDFMNEFFLQQIITTPTHKDGNVLDLLLTNNSNLIHSYHCIPTLNQISHHNIIEIATTYNVVFGVTQTNNISSIPRGTFDDYNYFDEDIKWTEINETLKKHDWVLEFKGLDPSQKFDRFLNVCQYISETFVPKRKVSQNSKRKLPPRERRVLMRKRNKIQKRLQTTCNKIKALKLKDALIKIEKQLRDSYKRKSAMDEANAIKAIKRNSKYFFSYAKKFSKVKTKVGPLLNKDNEYVNDSEQMADLLQEQYQSVFNVPNFEKKDPDELFTNEMHGLYDISFYDEDIMEAIDEICTTAAAGPDGYSAMFLKKCRDNIATPLQMIWRSCLDSGITPEILKLSFIVPIFKGGNQGLSANYRPVSLTSHLIKIFEKIIRKNIVSYMEEQNLFNCSQHGFRAGRSCLSQLLAHFDKILSYLEEGFNVDTIYLDFSKAFDKVEGVLIVASLQKYLS